jgi:teichuronic acid biosynthesis glycosyltransferase TuaG
MKTKSILISVIIPYYKKKNYIYSTLKSALNQSHKKIEVIIIYDDQDLSDFDYLKQIIKADKRVKIIINKKNQGVSISRNKGIKASKGKFITFLDADDIWNKNKLKFQLNFMRKNKCLISHTDYKIINSKNKILGYMGVKKRLSYNDLIFSCDIGLSTVMISKKLKSKALFPNMITKEDYILWLKLSKRFNIYGIQKNLGSWRKSDPSLSYFWQKIKDAFTLYSKYEKFNLFKSLFFVLLLSLNFIKKSLIQKIY